VGQRSGQLKTHHRELLSSTAVGTQLCRVFLRHLHPKLVGGGLGSSWYPDVMLRLLNVEIKCKSW